MVYHMMNNCDREYTSLLRLRYTEYGISLFTCIKCGTKVCLPTDQVDKFHEYMDAANSQDNQCLIIPELEVNVQKMKIYGLDETTIQAFREFIMKRFMRVE